MVDTCTPNNVMILCVQTLYTILIWKERNTFTDVTNIKNLIERDCYVEQNDCRASPTHAEKISVDIL